MDFDQIFRVVPEYLTHTREMYIGHLVTYKYVLYGQKKAELGKIV